jgi:hypothetical protein
MLYHFDRTKKGANLYTIGLQKKGCLIFQFLKKEILSQEISS